MRTVDSRSLDLLRSGDYAVRLYGRGIFDFGADDGVSFEENGVLIDDFSLIDKKGNVLSDRISSSLVYQSITFESTAQSTDERFWVTLALGDHREYGQKRWGHVLKDQTPEATKRHLENHFFCVTARNRFRDHSISRLWWLRRFIETADGLDRAKAEELFFGDGFSDFPVQLIGRPNLASLSNVTAEIVDFAHHKFIKTGQKYDRVRIRTMLQNLDILAGHQVPGLIDSSQIRQTLEAAYSFEIHLDAIPD
jgi:hypothetical protein